MPKRSETNTKEEVSSGTFSYDYKELLKHIRSHIDENLGGVAAFVNSPTFAELGFSTDPKDKAKIYTYLSIPTDSEAAIKVKSLPVLKKLYKGLLGVNITSKMEVIRKQTIKSDKELI